jgi:hypothetical protein
LWWDPQGRCVWEEVESKGEQKVGQKEEQEVEEEQEAE